MTLVYINEVVDITLVFQDPVGNQHRATIRCCILDTISSTLIIGLPDIIRHFIELYVGMIRSVGQVQELDSVISPWSCPIDPEAPEDDDVPLPCSFTDALNFMEKSVEDAEKEYFEMFDAHVAPEFRKASRIDDLLRSKGLRVFVPRNWTGITGIEPLELEFKDTFPERLKPRPRPVNPRLYANAKLEFDRLMKYFYTESSSPVASCLVIAPKATAPFIRFCGDYVAINKHIITGHYPIPIVRHELGKIIRFKIYLDFDLVNSYHQFLLAPSTSHRLSVQTPWGQVRPLFMPEGIPPASGILQKTMKEIFADFDEWTIVIFDNLLVLAHDYTDACRKAELILDRCIQRNLFLKFAKTWLGFQEVTFFGYVCKHLSYELSQKRKDEIMAFPMPTSVKKMQSFLGTALFFKHLFLVSPT